MQIVGKGFYWKCVLIDMLKMEYINRPTWLYIPPVTLLGVFGFGPNGDVVSCRMAVIKMVLRLRSAGPFYALSSWLGRRRRSGGYGAAVAVWNEVFLLGILSISDLGLRLCGTRLFLTLFRDMIPPSLFFLIFVTISIAVTKKN